MLAAAAAAAAAAFGFVDCEAEGTQPWGNNCAYRHAPADQSRESYEEWAVRHEAWRQRMRAELAAQPGGFSAYDNPGVAWTRTDWIQTKTLFHDRFLYDRETGQWTVDRYLDHLEELHGGVDSVVFWQFYPNSGVDDRNQFDYITSLPGDTASISEVVSQFHRRGVRVFWPVYPWDEGTRGTGRPHYVDLTEVAVTSGADGINGDTLNGNNVSWWDESLRRGHPLAQEPEVLQSSDGPDGQGFANLCHNTMSWGQGWGGMTGATWPVAPHVSAYNAIEPRHWVHITARWARNRTGELQHAWFNGVGYLAWENVWTVWNGITQRDAEALRRIRTVYRALGDGLVSGHERWRPHVPVSLHDGVFASEFTGNNRTLWTVVNRVGRDVGPIPPPGGWARMRRVDAEDAVLALPCAAGAGERYFDVWRGEEITAAECVAGVARLALWVEALGYAAVLRTTDGSAPAAEFMARMRALAARPLSSFDDVWRPLQQALQAQDPVPHAAPPAGTTPVPGGTYRFRCSSTTIEGDDLEDAVDVQMPWESHPQRHHDTTLAMTGLYVDTTTVTNAQYAAFLGHSGWRPARAQNWLLHWDHSGGAPAVRPGDEGRPVIWVSRDDALAYCVHHRKRLPETWEWQYAAQGGDGERRFPWGPDECEACVPPPDTGRAMGPPAAADAHPAGASAHGLLDLVGNVYQWTSEFRDNHTAKAVIRGGSHYLPHATGGNSPQRPRGWYLPEPADLREHSTFLLLSDSMDRSAGIGFRCVADMAPSK